MKSEEEVEKKRALPVSEAEERNCSRKKKLPRALEGPESASGMSEEEPGGLSARASGGEGAGGMKSEVGGLVGRQVPLDDEQHCRDFGECEV